MSQRFRIDGLGSVDRSRPLTFTFDGVAYQGYAGDTLASALIANGVHLVGRSYKYHRPRGILSAGAEEPNALVSLERGPGRFTPNLRATQIELYDGLSASSQNRWPSLAFDVGAVNDLLSPLFGAGFYYKTFMGPNLFGKNWAWTHIYEPAIRALPGSGRPASPIPTATSGIAHCDVLGGRRRPSRSCRRARRSASGARGHRSATNRPSSAARSPRRRRDRGDRRADWVARARSARAAQCDASAAHQAFGYFADNFLGLPSGSPTISRSRSRLPRERLWQVRANEVVLATGAIERPLVFPDNDRPGVMLADAARHLSQPLRRQARRRAWSSPPPMIPPIAPRSTCTGRRRNRRYRRLAARPRRDVLPQRRTAGWHPDRGQARDHRRRGTPARQRPCAVGAPAQADGSTATSLLMSGGWTPAVHLFSQSRGKLRFDEAPRFVPGSLGAARALRRRLQWHLRPRDALPRATRPARAGPPAVRRGRAAAYAVNGALPGGRLLGARPRIRRPRAKGFRRFPERRHRQGYEARRARGLPLDRARQALHDHRHGDRPGQDLQHERALPSPRTRSAADSRVGLTTFRTPYTPVTFGTLAGAARGDLFDPVRKTPIHGWAEEHGAVFEDVGLWKRARLFPETRRRHARRRPARMQGGPQRRRHFRCDHTRKNRSRRPRRRGDPRSALHQCLDQARRDVAATV